MNEEDKQPLKPEQVRVLASLMEKHLATPKNYPLTPNSLTSACNQKSNRYPVMALGVGKVGNIAQQLKELGYVSIDYGERIVKFSHRAPGMLKVTREEQAVLAMLMLREPLTANDLKARTEKMIGFETVEDVQAVIKRLMDFRPALVMELPVGVGQREERYTHLLAGEPDLSAFPVQQAKTSSRPQSEKIVELETRIARLESALDLLWEEE
jgi:uncharacterized protein YceH (UPF0502 family)